MNATAPSGYYQDANGKWHRPNGQYVSNAEVGLPTPQKTTAGIESGKTTPLTLPTPNGSEKLIHVYRGTDRYAEIAAYNETGHLMSDATRNLYFETDDLNKAYTQSNAIHDEWLKIWGNQNDYVQAHGEFGTELPQAFGLDRTFMSVTTDSSVAQRFAESNGQVFEAFIPKSQLIEQTLEGAGESEFHNR